MDSDGEKHFADVTLDGDELWLDYDGKGKELLIALSPTQFSWAGTIVDFVAAGNGGMNVTMQWVEGTDRGVRRP